RHWLKESAGENWPEQVLVVTDPVAGRLRKLVQQSQGPGRSGLRSLPIFPGVGGRYSELNIGLFHLALVGIEPGEVLRGAAAMAERCSSDSLWENPALFYAAAHFLLSEKGKNIAVVMPFSEGLRSTADWYAQLLAESLGKKFARKIVKTTEGKEEWVKDEARIVCTGRTPVACRGTNDLHSLHQNNIEGRPDKVVTLIKVGRFPLEVTLPEDTGALSGKKYSELLNLAAEATEWALVKAQRPNCTIFLPELSACFWGGLIYFWELATALEGELLNINAFDQPGVESYKTYLKVKLQPETVSDKNRQEVSSCPVRRQEEFIL
ncbi:MAG TPA: glucose-6-phosphate isomerase, partial [bacterium]|nr:glucose-6-phosphate isomerase [bacterium]